MNLDVIKQEIANEIEAQVRESFNQQKDALSGRNWTPLKPKTLKYKSEHKPILERSRLLRSSVRVDITPQGVLTRVNVPYAPFHQLGTRKMPARRFLPFEKEGTPSRQLLKAMEDIMNPEGVGGRDLLHQIAARLRM
ncbi:phage virion morphogenesis protein [Helicobacter cynogastricus]|uniref:phage virion morphogenesis protein n=1 Tax=Helicobacter cynogastricus TaxID=329937 RepID=UPI000CF15AA7|nr:phage virion morphogenesis protein [Helicobacter cynogastricus]